MFDRFSSTVVDSKLYYEHFIQPMLAFKDHIDRYQAEVNGALMQDFMELFHKFKPSATPAPGASKSSTKSRKK